MFLYSLPSIRCEWCVFLIPFWFHGNPHIIMHMVVLECDVYDVWCIFNKNTWLRCECVYRPFENMNILGNNQKWIRFSFYCREAVNIRFTGVYYILIYKYFPLHLSIIYLNFSCGFLNFIKKISASINN